MISYSYRRIFVVIFYANCALLVLLPLSCNCQNLQIIYLNSTYSHSFVNQQNNFGDGNGGAGGMNVDSGGSQHSSDFSGQQDDQRKRKPEVTPFSPYFGVEIVPYVKSASFPIGDYTNQDLKYMLNVILTKSHSILTMEMGFPDQSYTDGPWDVTAPSGIATVAAQLNNDHTSKQITISQGAGVLSKEGFQPDIEAAFYSAQHANSIFPGTVWGITLIPNYYDSQTEGYVQISKSGKRIYTQLKKHSSRAHEMNLKLGVFVDNCEDILGGPQKNILVEMAYHSDHFVCSIYPNQPVSDPQDYINVVTNLYQTIKTSFQRYSSSLEIILQTGWASQGKSRNNPEYMNSASKSKQFWGLMGQWAEERKVRVFMHEAFDIPKRSGNGSWGYWKWEEESFVEKATGQVVLT